MLFSDTVRSGAPAAGQSSAPWTLGRPNRISAVLADVEKGTALHNTAHPLTSRCQSRPLAAPATLNGALTRRTPALSAYVAIGVRWLP